MSLRHGLLGLLAHHPASGWDLLKTFESTLAFTWPATQSQLYTELGRMTDDGLIEVTATGARNRKEYAITDTGRRELVHWLTEVEPERNRRNDAVLRVFFLGELPPAEAVAYLERQVDAYRAYYDILTSVANGVEWADTDFDRGGRMALEYGLRIAQASREWAEWAAARVEQFSSTS